MDVDGTQDILESGRGGTQDALPRAVRRGPARDVSAYLAYTEHGASIATIAKSSGTHPSTVSRAIRRVEQRQADPVYDSPPAIGTIDQTLRRHARSYLRRLSEPGAVLIVARGAEKAGIFCAANDYRRPITMLPDSIAAEFLRQEWIAVSARGEASMRYRITDVGRSFLRRELAELEDSRKRPGMSEAPTAFQAQHRETGERLFTDPVTGSPFAMEVNLRESPVGWLSRRKGPDGKPFLAPEEVEAAERLRADFEAAQIGPSVAQDWRKFLTPGGRYAGSPSGSAGGGGSMAARERVTKALSVLGPGLADVALRTCCFLEGLEGCERRLGWSARSGKVVLKLALQRLVEHYGLTVFRS